MVQNEHVKINPLREKMLVEADLILKSVAFYEREINKAMSEIDEAENNKLTHLLPELEKRVRGLIKKIGKETTEMDIFLLKYKRLIHEK